jgi:hypothetical protein
VRTGSNLPARAAVPLLLVGAVVVAAGLAVEGRLAIGTDPECWVDENARAVTDLEDLRAGTRAKLPVPSSDQVVGAQGPTPPTRFGVMWITCPAGGSGEGGNFTPGPRYVAASCWSSSGPPPSVSRAAPWTTR